MKTNSKLGIFDLSDNELAKLGSEVDHLASVVGENFEPLTKAERRRLLKPRKGGQQMVATVGEIAVRYGVDNASAPVAEMLAKAEALKRFAPLAGRIQALATLAGDLVLSIESATFKEASALYKQMGGIAMTNPSLAAELSSVKQYFRVVRRPDSSKKTKPAKANGGTAADASTAGKDASSASTTAGTSSGTAAHA